MSYLHALLVLDGDFREGHLTGLDGDYPRQWSVESDSYDYADDSDFEEDDLEDSAVPSERTQMVSD